MMEDGMSCVVVAIDTGSMFVVMGILSALLLATLFIATRRH
jgi:hypothetical protein